MTLNGLDDKDNLIVNLLVENARLTYSEIGEKVGLTRVAVKNRVKALEDKGIIKGYHARIDPVAAPETVSFYAYIETTPGAYDAITERLKSEPVVSMLFHTSGNNGMYLICTAESKETRSSFAWRIRNSYEGVTYFSMKDIYSVEKGCILPT